MVIRRRVAVSNPHRPKKRKRTTKKKMSAKQIKFFGSARQRAALKASRRKKVTKKNPKTRVRTRVVVKKVYVRAKTRKRNPAKKRVRVAKRRRKNPQIISLGLLNPSKGRVTVTKRKRRSTTAKRRVRRHSNPKRRVVVMKKHHRRGTSRRRRTSNPNLMGNGKRVIAALGGFAAMKVLKGFVPASLTTSPAMGVAVDLGLAMAVGYGAAKFAPHSADDIQLGALITVANSAINAFFPSLAGYVGVSGMGIYQQARFAVPENPITRGYVPPASPSTKGVGLIQGRSF